MDALTVILLVAYSSLVLEITVFPIPSEASTYQLLFRANGAAGNDALDRARLRPTAAKLLLYLLPTALGVGLFIIPLIATWFPAVLGPLWPLDSWQIEPLWWSGATLVVAGRTVTFVSVLQLRAARSRGEAALGAEGLFRFSRNPGLVGMFAFYIGLALIFPCLGLFAGFAVYACNMHQRVRMEESRLVDALGPAYLAYAAATPRYLLWRSPPRSAS